MLNRIAWGFKHMYAFFFTGTLYFKLVQTHQPITVPMPRVSTPADNARRTYPVIGDYVLADGIQFGFGTSDLSDDWCTLVLVVPLRPLTSRQWAIRSTRLHEIRHTAHMIALAFHSSATTELQHALQTGYVAWDQSATVTFLGPSSFITVSVVV